ncbi:cysteine desulfurase [Chryseobacterium formosense]|uniref:cysteine desulfurase n=1 Tax=Chryseobacterium formosense TaxID=236814 RepID=A0A085ZA96_9FLAO|nr:cysteine desulfurase family protein [Chryseobacterium formosense]KFF01360.1 cysteine desulfurase [Chryseobacterium formosense]SFT46232.1 cysteine desulfurase [Chryseobacterium formosense]
MDDGIVYLDYNATTPVDKRVIQEMLPYFEEYYANASSNYDFSKKSKFILDEARLEIAETFGTEKRQIYFTSGATEGLNLALKGLALNPGNNKKHIITCSTEHKAVLEICIYLESIGYEIDYLPVNRDGSLDLELLKSTIRQDTLLICLMWVNNETGLIHPIKEIGKIAKESGVYFVCDATQGVGKLAVDVEESNIDILCFSGHKMYAPKGIGGLYINSSITKQNKIQPLIHGGGQENGMRGGTYNIPLIAGLKKAFEIAKMEMKENESVLTQLRNTVESQLLKINNAYINCGNAERIYNTVNVCIPDFDTELFIGMNKNIAVSNGSACTAGLVQPSHVLSTMGLSNEDALGSIRISMGRNTTDKDIFVFMERIHQFMRNV